MRLCCVHVDLPLSAFRDRLATLPRPPDPALMGDLLLAFACLEGQRIAIEALDRIHLADLGPRLHRFRLTPTETDELLQTLRERLLLGPRPKLATYTGSGPLGAWLHVVASRLALELLARRPSHGELLWDVQDLSPLTVDLPEATRGLLERHRAAVKESLEAVLATLSPQDRLTLRLHVVDGLGIDGIALVARVHRATAARWLCRIRKQIHRDLRKRLGVEIGGSTSELRSLVAHFRSDLSLSLTRLLGEEPSEP